MRTLPRLALLAVVTSLLGGALMVGQATKPSAVKMADAAAKFLATLSADEKKAATFALDDPHRSAWFFTPQQDREKNPTRKGLRLEKMTDKQKEAVADLLRAGLSAKGHKQAEAIMANEGLLAELEGKGGAMVRNTGWYFVSVFGEPSATGKWGWRVEGHHLSVNYTIDKGEVVSATPLLFASNPAEVKAGAKKGQRMLAETEDAAKELIASLTDDQKQAAKQAKQFPEIKEGQPKAGVGDPVGIPASKLTADQNKTLTKLVEAYADRLPGDVAAGELKRVQDAGPGKVYFAYCVEEDKPGKPYTYRIHGPTFVVEFLNVQGDSAKNPANHIHSGWRTLPQDFGLGK
jgi:ATP-dependent Clp protease ATP-binding subunit ClpA